jgi:hypothetical protein
LHRGSFRKSANEQSMMPVGQWKSVNSRDLLRTSSENPLRFGEFKFT